MMLADVILPLALQGSLTYRVPATLAPQVRVGMLVIVPVRRKHYTAIVISTREAEDQSTLRDMTSIVEPLPLVRPEQLRLWRWMAQYYMCTPGEVAKAALPAGFKDEEKMARRAAKTSQSVPDFTLPTVKPLPEQLRHQLSEAQETAVQQIGEAWDKTPVVLLHGVTSSGKTEVYIRLIQEALARGEQVLYLVPEIALTTQLTTRLGKVFGEQMGIWHSKFTDKQRMDLWRRQLTPEAYPLVLGVRSAVFLPWQRLGLIIVDEEHEQSYKQQDPAPRYHARDVATVIGQMLQAHVLLGSATPALETYTNAKQGKYGYVTLTQRYGGVEMPEIVVENMKELKRKKLLTSPFSPRLTEETRDALREGQQAIFFQNRRGYSPVLTCRSCGWTPKCTRCDVSLTFHKAKDGYEGTRDMGRGTLRCHYCGATYQVPVKCPQCGDTELRDIGYGTEKIEAAAKAVFPDARIQRMDLDTTRSRRSYEEIITDFQAGKKNLLVGTQMVTKGLDFGRVRVVGILHADQMLTQPDFRAYERSFQMLSQVAGRAGRRSGRGRVILQTSQPELPVVQHIVRNDYEAFYAQEMEERQLFRYPPCARIIYIYVKSPKDQVAETAARVMADMLRPYLQPGDLLGPERPYVARVSLQYIRRIMIKTDATAPPTDIRRLLMGARQYIVQQPDLKGVNIYFDVDPV
ncbi:MAG: primosomal protein N' [Bacteroidaceae bacterium]|nr:primosomal protein N' [Bacteroidaceae bacterium]